jgi:hypothetical protein
MAVASTAAPDAEHTQESIMNFIVTGLFALAVAGQAVAADLPSDIRRDSGPYDNRGNPNYRYQGPTGTQYQYDLSRPSDQIRYEVDPRAQIRDGISVDPRRDLDRDLGRCDVQHCRRISGVFNSAMNQADYKNAV